MKFINFNVFLKKTKWYYCIHCNDSWCIFEGEQIFLKNLDGFIQVEHFGSRYCDEHRSQPEFKQIEPKYSEIPMGPTIVYEALTEARDRVKDEFYIPALTKKD